MFTIDQINEIQKCTDPVYFIENYYYLPKGFDDNEKLIKLYPHQKDIINAIQENNYTEILSSRQSGKTTALTAYATWYAIFNPYKNILITSVNFNYSSQIIKNINYAIKNLPKWFGIKFKEDNRRSFQLHNGTRVIALSKSPNEGRGYSCNLLILDETEYVNKEQFISLLPTIAASAKGKIVASGHLDIQNKFTVKVPWNCLPHRTTEWKTDTINSIGKKAWDHEFE